MFLTEQNSIAHAFSFYKASFEDRISDSESLVFIRNTLYLDFKVNIQTSKSFLVLGKKVIE